MECRSRVLLEVLPAAREGRRKWFQIDEYIGDSAEIRNCLPVVTTHFSAYLKRNVFDVISTAFAFSPFGHS
jgi:hypothetical protein